EKLHPRAHDRLRRNPMPMKNIAALGLAALGQYFLIQQDQPWTLWVGLALMAAALFFFLQEKTPPQPARKGSRKGLSPKTEGLFFFLILLIAALFRFYRLEDFPAGVFPDDACGAYGALRILHEGWRPFREIFLLHTAVPTLYYEEALWFRFFPATAQGLFAFSATLSMLSLGLFYGVFRKLAGPLPALLALFLLAVMRWDVTFARNAHVNADMLFWMAASLLCWLWALDSKRWTRFAIAGAVLALGSYSYTAFY